MQRDTTIDNMRFLAMIFIMLAHVQAPEWIMNIRCFEVPLIILVSGLTMADHKLPKYTTFLRARTVRLLVPVYIYIIPFMIALYIAQNIHLFPDYIDKEMAISTLLLQDGIGYVWIFKVFLFIMLLTPILKNITEKTNNDVVFLLVIGCIIAIQEAIAISLDYIQEGTIHNIYKYYVTYILSYAPLFMLGIKIRHSSISDKKGMFWTTFAILLIAIFAVIYYLDNGFTIPLSPNFKYPPRAYYIIYGIGMSVLIWELRFLFKTDKWGKLPTFIGQNTMWIYLWHIPFIIATNHFLDNFILKYAIVLTLSVFTYYIQYNIVKKTKSQILLKYFIG